MKQIMVILETELEVMTEEIIEEPAATVLIHLLAERVMEMVKMEILLKTIAME